uniref:RadC-like JAB domain-containing protein n=1 Tax=Candidatus Kentrum sp. LFY TaxID=2126342 RepID=A0A450WZ04_9GAMM|nr:MAG: RadC-like JAB domain-containing protein [Candidatus Kentron sp. LFY]VFJ90542.1 MAG: RadC-like JAB domain-containing protein [Candidatus Kentron sp. LFY]VFK22243.1 MAG: RadC-like JAB domain-containing protein [Candidatus Kentron sp. LFY]
MLVHNHMGGTLEPSGKDEGATRALIGAGKLLGIIAWDHPIISMFPFSLAV